MVAVTVERISHQASAVASLATVASAIVAWAVTTWAAASLVAASWVGNQGQPTASREPSLATTTASPIVAVAPS